MSKKAAKKPAKTPARSKRKSSANTSAPVLAPQPHGGALQVGNPGNKGGGRPPDEFKRRMQEIASAEDRVVALEHIMDKAKLYDPALFLKAHQYVTERGYGKADQPVSVDNIRDRLRDTITAIRDALPAADAERVLERLRPIWS